AAGATDYYAFDFTADELAGTSSGRVLLRVVVTGSGGFVPAAAAVFGLQPVSVRSNGGQVVALFSVERDGLYRLHVRGAGGSGASYALQLGIAGDLDADGFVDGRDSAQLAGLIGKSRGDAGYDFAGDLDGDGLIDATDRLVYAVNSGFVSGRALVAPDVPLTLDLDPASDSAPLGDGRTSLGAVTLVGRAAPLATVKLGNLTAIADCNGVFAFFDVPLSVGRNTFTVTSTEDGEVRQASFDFTRLAFETDGP